MLGTTLLSGCSEDAEAPGESLPSATSSTPTTEALPVVGPADFPVPPEARTQDAAGAEAFLRYWIDLLDRQRAVPAGQPLRDLGPDCGECQRIAKNYDDAAASGWRYVGGELTLNDVPAPVMEADTAYVSFGIRQEAIEAVDGAGAVIDSQPLAPNVFGGIDLTWSPSDQAWIVTSFGFG
ncbi:hypothetical protein LY71_10819 [Geodermatophilus tzadiensis]|uniref:DUF6318 domain-containing protein n=1 Tax=Geodermatophilus tzadiensis TaxID=1137988 RepID=A0A2T0TSK6_9ACTN|nr:hypothetical protein LY71_10819 [Geodermatophilus tzadiensis]